MDTHAVFFYVGPGGGLSRKLSAKGLPWPSLCRKDSCGQTSYTLGLKTGGVGAHSGRMGYSCIPVIFGLTGKVSHTIFVFNRCFGMCAVIPLIEISL